MSKNIGISVMSDLCCDIILGHDILQHKSIEIAFGGTQPTLHVCTLTAMNVPNPTVFENLTLDCKPISAKSRHYSLSDKRFIELETAKLVENDIIEPSISSWRSQVLVTSNEHHKKGWLLTIAKQ